MLKNDENLKLNCRKLLVIAVTSPISMAFFKGQIEYLQKAGFDIVVVCSPGWELISGVRYYPVAMEREISPLKDLSSLFRLIKLFVKIKPEIVNAGTPKAGLLVTLAAFLTRVPLRIYTCHGLRLETTSGWKRKLLSLTEKIAASCAHQVVCVSDSLRSRYAQLNLAEENKITVIGNGSCNGINLDQYIRNIDNVTNKQLYKVLFGKTISDDSVFIGFIGRLTRDKGIYELIEAYKTLSFQLPNLYLLLLGGFEEGDPVNNQTQDSIFFDERIINLGWISDPIQYYRLMQLLILPTYREGLPTVLLEAAAMEVPVVATRATGCVDVVVEGETGLLVPIGDSKALAEAITLLLQNKTLRENMGRNARQRMEKLFRQEIVWENTLQFYTKHLVERRSNYKDKELDETC